MGKNSSGKLISFILKSECIYKANKNQADQNKNISGYYYS